jgi:hypothetical protein
MPKEHAVRALVLHATPAGDFCVCACDGTATTVLVRRTISPVCPSHLNKWVYMTLFAPFITALGTVINPQRDLMQDVGPGISAHIPALLPVPVAHTVKMTDVTTRR